MFYSLLLNNLKKNNYLFAFTSSSLINYERERENIYITRVIKYIDVVFFFNGQYYIYTMCIYMIIYIYARAYSYIYNKLLPIFFSFPRYINRRKFQGKLFWVEFNLQISKNSFLKIEKWILLQASSPAFPYKNSTTVIIPIITP